MVELFGCYTLNTSTHNVWIDRMKHVCFGTQGIQIILPGTLEGIENVLVLTYYYT